MLYKYTHENRINDILEKNYIRFTQPIYFNDPFELKPNIIALASKEEIEQQIEKDYQQILKEEYNKNCVMKQKMTFEQFEKIMKTKKDLIKKQIKEVSKSDFLKTELKQSFEKQLNEKLGILSLTTKKDNLLMWAHYANEHRGFIIELDDTHSFFNQNEKYHNFLGNLLKVNYSQTRPSHELSNFSETTMFLTKSKEWEYEEEYRMFLPLSEADDSSKENIYLFKIPTNAIKSIYCGCNMLEENKLLIFNLIKNNEKLQHIKVFNSKISVELFELEFEQRYPN